MVYQESISQHENSTTALTKFYVHPKITKKIFMLQQKKKTKQFIYIQY